MELSYEVIPGGLVFPMGFLLFWAFYYTFYKPGYLEERLSTPAKWDLMAIPAMLLGVAIWFVKVTLAELGHFVFLKWWTPTGARPAPGATHSRPKQAPRPQAAASPSGSGPKPMPKADPLPSDLVQALMQLGLKPGCHWRRHPQTVPRASQAVSPRLKSRYHRRPPLHARRRRLPQTRSRPLSLLSRLGLDPLNEKLYKSRRLQPFQRNLWRVFCHWRQSFLLFPCTGRTMRSLSFTRKRI